MVCYYMTRYRRTTQMNGSIAAQDMQNSRICNHSTLKNVVLYSQAFGDFYEFLGDFQSMSSVNLFVHNQLVIQL